MTSLSDPCPNSLCSVSFTVPTRARSSQKGPSFSWRAAADEVVAFFGRSPSRWARGAAARGAARALLAPAVPPHPMRRCGARPPLLCDGGSCSLRARCAPWSVAARDLCVRLLTGSSRPRRVLRGGRHRAALAAPLRAAPLVCSSRPPCRRIRCGGVALGRRSSAAAARALCAHGRHVLRAVAVALLSRRRCTRRRSCAPRVHRAAASDAAWWRSAAASLRRKRVLSAWCASWSVAARALCVRPLTRSLRSSGDRRRAGHAAPLHAAPLVRSSRPPCRRIRCGVVALGRRSSAAAARALSVVRVVVGGGQHSLHAAADEVVAFFAAAAVALLSRRRSTRCRSCAPRARRAAASDVAWWRSAAALLRRRLVLSMRCASWSVAARALCVRLPTRSSRSLAVAVALLSRRRCTRCPLYAPRTCRAAASKVALWRSAAAPLRRRLALSARAVRAAVGCGVCPLRAAAGGVAASSGAVAVARLSRRRCA